MAYVYAILFYIVMNLVAGYSITLFVDIKAAYAALELPSWAPAAWVFGAAWTTNNILVLWGNVWTLYAPRGRTMQCSSGYRLEPVYPRCIFCRLCHSYYSLSGLSTTLRA
jgi:hypothetical protein